MYADIDDLIEFYEVEIPQDRIAWAESKIVAAEALLISYVPRLADPSQVSELDAVNARTAILQAVTRVLRNPGGFKSHVTGPFQGVRHESAGDGTLMFKPEELAPFQPRRRRRFGMFSVARPNGMG